MAGLGGGGVFVSSGRGDGSGRLPRLNVKEVVDWEGLEVENPKLLVDPKGFPEGPDERPH
jgi:hypothetical protein